MKKFINTFLFFIMFLGFLFIFPVSRTSALQLKYDYQYIEQSAYPDTLEPGESTFVWLKIKNTGTNSWYNKSGYDITRLGSGSKYGAANQQRDYPSEFYNSDWLSRNRPTYVLSEEIKPGETATFAFTITAPIQQGTYKAYFTPVVDGVTWMKDIGIYWQIKSEKRSAISVDEARTIAENTSVCTENGTLANIYMYNGNSKTWWVDLGKQGGCFPACVINEETKTADINWRCTGAL